MSVKNVVDNYIKENKIQFSINRARILPFNSRSYRVQYKNGFNGIIGEIFRIIEGCLIKEIDFEKRIVELIDDGKIELDDKDTFISVIDEFNPQKIYANPTSISSIKFFPLGERKFFTKSAELSEVQKERNRKEVDIAEFIYFNILNENEDLNKFINKKSGEDVISKFYEVLFINEDKIINKKNRYIKYSKKYDDLIKDDLKFLLLNDRFFVKNIELFVSFYFFVYAINVINSIDINAPKDKLYWMLDSEKSSNSREAICNGWKQFNESSSKKSWVNNLLLDILATLTDNDSIKMNEFLTKDYTSDIVEIINKFNNIINNVDIKTENITNNFNAVESLRRLLFYYYESTKKQGTESRNSLWIEELGKKLFLKFRSKYGYVLNITDELLLMLVSVIVKKDKLKLNILFDELERRGVYLDNKSRKEVVRILDKQGILEKKSDSGDAQYVRRVIR